MSILILMVVQMAFSPDTALPLPTAALYAKLTATAVFWGGTFVAGRALAGQLDPLASATGRFGIAVLCLLVLTRCVEGGLPRLTLSQLGLTLGLGLTGVVSYNLFFFAALTEMPASRTALFVAFNPISVTVVMVVFGQERMTLRQVAGILVALFGALVVISKGDLLHVSMHFGRGEAYMCGAVLSWVGYTVIGRSAMRQLSALAATTYAALWGFAILAGALLWSMYWSGHGPAPQGLRLDVAAALFYLAIGGTVVPFVWYSEGIRALGAGRAAVFNNLVPCAGVLLGFVILSEPLTAAMLAGGGVVILGVALTNRG